MGILQTKRSPQKVARSNDNLTIEWTDGSCSTIPAIVLRKNCPCAGCRESRGDDSHSKPLTGKRRALTIIDSSLEQETTLIHVWSVGAYAIGLKWKDGHDSGIYTFELLQQLSDDLVANKSPIAKVKPSPK